MKYEVILRLHDEDDATGEWGLCHANAVGKFNTFWGPDGIFHDVFEHYFEDNHKYFSGNAAFSVWGEMCASGHGIAYADIGVDNFRYRQSSRGRDFTVDTTTLITDWLHGYVDWLDFPIDRCDIPVQKYKCPTTLRHWMNEYESFWYEQRDKGRDKIKMIPKKYIYRSYIYGYKQALQIIGGDKQHAYNVLDKFLEQWHYITKHQANELYLYTGTSEEGPVYSDYGIYGFKFVVETNPNLNVTCTVIDDLKNEYPLTNLSIYQ